MAGYRPGFVLICAPGLRRLRAYAKPFFGIGHHIVAAGASNSGLFKLAHRITT
jgi:hypothetical protein